MYCSDAFCSVSVLYSNMAATIVPKRQRDTGGDDSEPGTKRSTSPPKEVKGVLTERNGEAVVIDEASLKKFNDAMGDAAKVDAFLCFDLEFTGAVPWLHAAPWIGLASLCCHNGRVTPMANIGPIKMRKEQAWNEDTRKFWKEEMPKQYIEILEDKTTIERHVAMKKFHAVVAKWVVDMTAVVGSYRDITKQPPVFAWMSDTCSNDATHLNFLLYKTGKICGTNTDGRNALTKYFKSKYNYRDVYNTDPARDVCAVLMGCSAAELKLMAGFPVNKEAHNAMSDAVYIAECFQWYRERIREHFIKTTPAVFTGVGHHPRKCIRCLLHISDASTEAKWFNGNLGGTLSGWECGDCYTALCAKDLGLLHQNKSNGYTGIVTNLYHMKPSCPEPINITLTWLGPVDEVALAKAYQQYVDHIGLDHVGTRGRTVLMELEWTSDSLVTLGKEEDIKAGKGVEARECRFTSPLFTDVVDAIHHEFCHPESDQEDKDRVRMHMTVGKCGVTREELLAFKGPFYANDWFVKNKQVHLSMLQHAKTGDPKMPV
jgi:hypothetical protein